MRIFQAFRVGFFFPRIIDRFAYIGYRNATLPQECFEPLRLRAQEFLQGNLAADHGSHALFGLHEGRHNVCFIGHKDAREILRQHIDFIVFTTYFFLPFLDFEQEKLDFGSFGFQLSMQNRFLRLQIPYGFRIPGFREDVLLNFVILFPRQFSNGIGFDLELFDVLLRFRKLELLRFHFLLVLGRNGIALHLFLSHQGSFFLAGHTLEF
mmetsp:Transcript_13061/g.30782  ORF Transcript_13061/g.30782 Transcript_13061/m.30782 type:complete len:209 (-) Transcript_13061:683-1309(-)